MTGRPAVDVAAYLGDERIVWYLMRGTGVVLQVLLTLSVVLGVAATARVGNRWWPQFATQSLHRTVSLLSVLLLVGHVATAVVHTFVDIRWWQAFVPFAGTYEPLWLGLGALSLDLLAVVVATSLVRRRLDHRLWRGIHLAAYASWAVGVVHGLGIGTDATTVWAGTTTAVCVGLVALAGLGRLVTLRGEAPHGHTLPPEPALPRVELGRPATTATTLRRGTR